MYGTGWQERIVTPSLDPCLKEREGESRQTEVALYPKQVRIVWGNMWGDCWSTVKVEPPIHLPRRLRHSDFFTKLLECDTVSTKEGSYLNQRRPRIHHLLISYGPILLNVETHHLIFSWSSHPRTSEPTTATNRNAAVDPVTISVFCCRPHKISLDDPKLLFDDLPVHQLT